MPPFSDSKIFYLTHSILYIWSTRKKKRAQHYGPLIFNMLHLKCKAQSPHMLSLFISSYNMHFLPQASNFVENVCKYWRTISEVWDWMASSRWWSCYELNIFYYKMAIVRLIGKAFIYYNNCFINKSLITPFFFYYTGYCHRF